MDKNNPNTVTYRELCALLGFDPQALMDATKDFIDTMTAHGRWDTAPHGAREDILHLYEAMETNAVIPEDKLDLLEMFARVMMGLESLFEMPLSSLAERLDDQPPGVRALVSASIAFNEAAEAMKRVICTENGGPGEFPANIVYVTPIAGREVDPDFQNLNSDNYNMHVTQVDIEEGDDGLEYVRELLAEAFEELGPPVMIAMTCDTYLREFESADEATSASGRHEIENMEDLFMRPDSGVCQALASIVMGKNLPVVTTISKYRYDDVGQPEFVIGGASYAVNPVSEIMVDPSHRGQVCALFLSYLHLGEMIS